MDGSRRASMRHEFQNTRFAQVRCTFLLPVDTPPRRETRSCTHTFPQNDGLSFFSIIDFSIGVSRIWALSQQTSILSSLCEGLTDHDLRQHFVPFGLLLGPLGSTWGPPLLPPGPPGAPSGSNRGTKNHHFTIGFL